MINAKCPQQVYLLRDKRDKSSATATQISRVIHRQQQQHQQQQLLQKTPTHAHTHTHMQMLLLLPLDEAHFNAFLCLLEQRPRRFLPGLGYPERDEELGK